MTTYVCDRGHERETHKSVPAGHGKQPACIECSAPIVERTVPLFKCRDCGHRWFYTGSANRPTCPACKGKAVEQAD